MGIVVRQSVKSTLVIFLGALLGAITLLLSVKYLTQQELGFNRSGILFQAIVASQFALMGMSNVMAIFIHKYEPDDPRRHTLIGICFAVPVFITLLGSIFYFILKPEIISLLYNTPSDKILGDRYYVLLPICTLLYSLMILLEFYLNSQMKIALSIFIREVVLRLLTIGLIILYIVNLINFDVLMYGTILIHSIPIVILYFLSKRTQHFQIKFDFNVFSKKELKDIFHFAWYHMLMGITLSLMGLIDSLMLAPLDKDGMNTVGVYGIAIFLMSILIIPYRSMSTASLPGLTKAYEAQDVESIRNLFQRGGINILIAAVGMCIIVLMNTPNAVNFLNQLSTKGESYDALLSVVPILILGRLTDMGTGLNSELISISKYYKFNFRISIVLIVLMFILIGVLVPKMGIYGAAWGATIALIIFNICKMIFLWKKMQLHPFSNKSVGVLIAGILAAASVYLIPYTLHPILDAIVRTSIMMLVYISALLILKPSPDLQEYLANLKKNKRLF